jgi:2'-5' RNA ligase
LTDTAGVDPGRSARLGAVTDAAGVRLFVALWPEPSVRAGLATVRDAWHWPPNAKPVPEAKLHATLHFIGDFPRDRLAVLAAALDRVETAPLRLGLAASELWHGGIAVVTLSEARRLHALQARVGVALASAGVVLETRPFRPHVTLARHARGAQRPTSLPTLEWALDTFALVASRGGGYHVLATWGAAGRRGVPAGGAGFT